MQGQFAVAVSAILSHGYLFIYPIFAVLLDQFFHNGVPNQASVLANIFFFSFSIKGYVCLWQSLS